MARTKAEIFDAMMAMRLSYATLESTLTSESRASFYQSFFMLFSEFASDFENNFDDFQANTEALLEAKQVMQRLWWQDKSLAFQLGDPLVRDESGNLVYEEVDEDKYIVERASVQTTENGRVSIKVAKTQGSTPVPLDADELTAFTSYANDITVAGIVPDITSVNGDEITFNISVEVDGKVISPDDGTAFSDGSKPVEDAINAYFATFLTQDSFSAGGLFVTNTMLCQINEATGVFNTVINSLQKKAQNESNFTNVLSLQGRKFQSFSGYVRLADDFDVGANITYTAV